MSFDLGAIRAAHKRFLMANERMLDAQMQIAKSDGLKRVKKRPGFTPRTGKTQKSVRARIMPLRNGRRLVFRSSRRTALWMDKGTRPHYIQPKNMSPLRFQIGGRWVSTWAVDHPGTRAYGFMRNARDYAYGRVGSRLRRHMERLARSF